MAVYFLKPDYIGTDTEFSNPSLERSTVIYAIYSTLKYFIGMLCMYYKIFYEMY